MIKIIGLDLSLNGTGIVSGYITDKFYITDKKVFTDIKNDYETQRATYIYYKLKNKPTETERMERFYNVFNYIKTYINKNRPNYVAIEDYAYASVGQVFNIAELCGSIKLLLFINNIKYRTYAPTSIKMFIADNGAAKKEQVVKAIYRKYDIDFSEYVSEKKGGVSKRYKGDSGYDLADAYSLCQLLTTELLLRNGNIKLSDLGKKQVQVFNTITKSNPINILAREFICQKN